MKIKVDPVDKIVWTVNDPLKKPYDPNEWVLYEVTLNLEPTK